MSKPNLQVRIPQKPESPGTIPESSPLQSVKEEAFGKLHRSIPYNALLIVGFLLAVGEAILVGFGAQGVVFVLQIAFLAASSGLALFQLIIQWGYLIVEDDIGEIKRSMLLYSLFDSDVIFEIACLAFGWATLFVRPGLSALRCIRVFRFLWYSHLYGADKSPANTSNPYFFGLRQALNWTSIYLERLSAELFSSSSYGGIVVVGIFFYVAYLFAVIFWIEESDLLIEGSKYGNDCRTLNNCFITMLRLAFFDTNGFDYLQGIMNSGARGYAFLLLLYVIVAGIILLNGLIGIFSRVFAPIRVATAASVGSPGTLARQSSQKKAIGGGGDRFSVNALRPITPTVFVGAHAAINQSNSNHSQSAASDEHTEIAELATTIEHLRLEILGLNGKISHIHEMLRSRLVVGPIIANNSNNNNNHNSSQMLSPVAEAKQAMRREQLERQKSASLERTIDRAALMAKKMSQSTAFSFSVFAHDEEDEEIIQENPVANPSAHLATVKEDYDHRGNVANEEGEAQVRTTE